tara:strand:- start:275 stop:1117 length:843 start_codon:yes stop_codon:yes gene_type:complete
MVLGTAQFGMDYGIANVSGKPTKKEVFNILSHAWEKGVWRFDAAPGYSSESLLGEFISTNGLQDKVKVLTKIPSLDGLADYETIIKSTELSLKNLGCPIDVLFFHDPNDSMLLLKAPEFFDGLLHDYPIASLGVSVYEPNDVEKLVGCPLELAFQFPCNVLDRRFENIRMPKGKRYARSIFLQGLLASADGLRSDSPKELQYLQKNYHERLAKKNLNPISIAISFIVQNDVVDHFLFGVDSEKQIKELLDLELFGLNDIAFLEILIEKKDKRWLDPRKWN